MSTLGSSVKTMADWTKERDPSGKALRQAELLSQTNEMIDDALFKEGNQVNGELVVIQTGLPTTYWRLMNQGTPNSTDSTAQVTENCGNLVARCQVDADIANLNGDIKNYRMNAGKSFLEAMNQEMQSTEIYGSAANPEEFVGFANRYTATTEANGENIILGGGAGADNTSMYLIGWGENSIYNIFPKGTVAGLSHEDKGEQEVADSSGNYYTAYVDYWKWKTGLVVKDWRYGVRIPNIDISDLVALANSQATTASTFLPNLMARAIDRLPTMGSDIKPAFYCNRTVKSHLRIMAMRQTSSVLSIEDGLNQFGKKISELKFLGIPVRTVDALTNAEALVS